MKTLLLGMLLAQLYGFGNEVRPVQPNQPNRPNFPEIGRPGTITNPYRFQGPGGRRFRVYTNGPIEPGSPTNPYQIRPE